MLTTEMTAPATRDHAVRILGHERILEALRRALRRHRLASAYCFSGPNAVGKRTVARQFLQSILCEQRIDGSESCGTCRSCIAWRQGYHPDAILLEGKSENAPITIDSIRDIQKKLSFRPSVSRYRVALIDNADHLTLEAANALLKTLEEPPPQTVIVLCAPTLSTLPLTVRSRCQQFIFQLVPRDAIVELLRGETESQDLAQAVSHLALGRPGLALTLLRTPDEYARYREQVTALLHLLQAPLPERLRELKALIPNRLSAHDARQELMPLLDLLLWLIRDILLIREHLEDHAVHHFLVEDLRHMAERASTPQLLRSMELVSRTKLYLLQNVNPSLALEHLFVNIETQ